MEFVSSRKMLLLGASALASAVAVVSPGLAAGDIPWKAGELFERTSYDEDVKDVLRQVLKQNGQQVIFRPGVKGAVTFQFQNIPLQAAFNKLVQENGLDFEYDQAINTVTIMSASAQTTQQAFVPLGHVDPDTLKAAIKDFGVGGNISINRATNTALIKGTAEQVSLLKSLIKDMDDAEGGRQKTTVERQRVSVEQMALQQKQLADASRAAMEKQMFESLLNTDVRIIKLKYANVTKTSKKFYDKEVEIPGVDETLQKLLGDYDALAKNLPKDQAERFKDMISPLSMSRPTISVDTRTNSVIVRGTPTAIEQVARMVRELDKPVPLVEIETIIVKAVEGLTQQLGINWAGGDQKGSRNESYAMNSGIASPYAPNSTEASACYTACATSGVVSSNSAVPKVRALSLLPTMGAAESFVGSYVMESAHTLLQAQLRAYEADNRAQTIASPRVVTVSNVPAKMAKRDDRFITIQGASGSSGTLQKVQAGVELDITPAVVIPDDASERTLVRLNIKATNTVPIVAPGAVSVSLSGNEVTTEVMVPNEATFVLGGMLDDAREKSVSGIPLLKDIPLVGQLFRTDSDATAMAETVFFITPKVIYPDQIAPSDVASRRYMQRRQKALGEAAKELQTVAPSTFSPIKRSIQEDE